MNTGTKAHAGGVMADARPFVWGAACREAGIVAAIIFGLSALMVGIEVRDVPGGLALHGRYVDVFAAMVAGFVGRLAIILLRENRPSLASMIIGTVVLVLSMRVLFKEEVLWLARGAAEVPRAVLDAVLSIFGASSGLAAEDFIPFKSSIITWMLFIVSCILLIIAVRRARQSGAVETAADTEETMDRFGAAVQRVSRFLGPIMIVIALALPIMAWPGVRSFLQSTVPFLPAVDLQVMDIAILVVTYIMLGWGLNIVVGLAGLLDLGYVAFYAVGAYSYALLAQHAGLGFWACLPFAGLMAATAGVILGFPVLRLRGDYLAIVTLGFGEMIRVILLNWYSLTRGPDGIGGIPRPSFFGLPFQRYPAEGTESFHTFFGVEFNTIHRYIFLYLLILVLALITNFFTLRIRRLPVGRAWEALREDEIACRSLGINPTNTKLTAFGIGAMFGGFAGSFFATRQGFISPESFTFIESAIILAIVVLGGMGSQIGVVFAAIILIGLPEIFRDLQQFRMLFFGGAMVLIMLWRPSGLLAHREPTIRLSRWRREPVAEAAE